jgi:hypothetical protein
MKGNHYLKNYTLKQMISLLTPYFQVMMLKVSEKNKTIEKFPLKGNGVRI